MAPMDPMDPHRTRRAGPHESGGGTEPRVLSLLDRSLGPAARPITAPILGSLVKRIGATTDWNVYL